MIEYPKLFSNSCSAPAQPGPWHSLRTPYWQTFSTQSAQSGKIASYNNSRLGCLGDRIQQKPGREWLLQVSGATYRNGLRVASSSMAVMNMTGQSDPDASS